MSLVAMVSTIAFKPQANAQNMLRKTAQLFASAATAIVFAKDAGEEEKMLSDFARHQDAKYRCRSVHGCTASK